MKALLLAVFLSQEEAATDVATARERERVARLSLEAAKSKEAISGAVTARAIAFHGHDDPFVPPAQVAEFQAEMTRAKVDWQLVIFGNCAHSFTVPTANNPAGGQVFNGPADARSFAGLRSFLTELFGE